jgi:hypothetical protein
VPEISLVIKKISANQKTKVRAIHFDMFRNLLKISVAKITLCSLRANSVPISYRKYF